MLQKSKKLGILRPSLRYLYNEIRVIFFILHHAHFVVDLAVFFYVSELQKIYMLFFRTSIPEAYSKPCQTFKLSVNYLHKTFYLSYFTGL